MSSSGNGSEPLSAANQIMPAKRPLKAAKLKKPPQAPKRFKSSFIFFSMEKHKEIKAQMDAEGCAMKTVMVAEAWKSLSSYEREKCEDLARKDMERFQAEKSVYLGPWKVPVGKRTLKDPAAPKRPMSAFLAFSNKRRGAVKRQNPKMNNAELSRALSVMWKEAPEEQRKKYIDDELVKREQYKTKIVEWKKLTNAEKIRPKANPPTTAPRVALEVDLSADRSLNDEAQTGNTELMQTLRSATVSDSAWALDPPASRLSLPTSFISAVGLANFPGVGNFPIAPSSQQLFLSRNELSRNTSAAAIGRFGLQNRDTLAGCYYQDNPSGRYGNRLVQESAYRFHQPEFSYLYSPNVFGLDLPSSASFRDNDSSQHAFPRMW